MHQAFRTVIATAGVTAGVVAMLAAADVVRERAARAGVNGRAGGAADARTSGEEADAGRRAAPAKDGELAASGTTDENARAGRPVVIGGMLPGLPALRGGLADGFGSAPGDADADRTDPDNPHSFYFTRARYSDGGGWGRRRGRRYGGDCRLERNARRCSWGIDYAKADLQFITVLKRLAKIDASDRENSVRLDDPDLRRFPYIYALEVGEMSLTDEEVEGLRSYLLAGGFLVIDDFWGSREWANFEYEISRVLPEYPIVEMDLDHEIFHSYYDIEEILQVCAINNCRSGRTWENDGYVPHARGIFDENGRLLVMINWNTDLGDAWEWAEQPDYPVNLSTYAFKMGLNFIIYAMSH